MRKENLFFEYKVFIYSLLAEIIEKISIMLIK
jgi:hypothetical protein